jgi:hypothetical protein
MFKSKYVRYFFAALFLIAFPLICLELGSMGVRRFNLLPEVGQTKTVFRNFNAVPDHPFAGYRIDPHRKNQFLEDSISEENARPFTQVLIAGGSVAQQFYEQRKRVLTDELVKRWGRTRVSSIALSGLKQPQQLMTLLYGAVLDRYPDVVVNLDGFNEVALPTSENLMYGAPTAFPRQWATSNYQATLSFKVIAFLRNTFLSACDVMIAASKHLPRNSAWVVNNGANALIKKIDIVMNQAVEKRVRTEKSKEYFSGNPILTTEAIESSQELRESIDKSIEIWARSSLLMNEFCKSHGIKYIHLLQPNQHLIASKKFTREETKLIEAPSMYKAATAYGYPKMIEKGESLKRQGVRFYDLTQTFLDTSESVYRDTCCHLNSKGNAVLATRILDILQKELPHAPKSRGRLNITMEQEQQNPKGLNVEIVKRTSYEKDEGHVRNAGEREPLGSRDLAMTKNPR